MRRLRAFLPYAALLAEVLVFYRKVLFSSQWGIPWDLRGYHLPLATYISGALQHGRLPLWDPYTYCGTPFYANLQTQLFYPPAWPAFIAGALSGGRGLLDLLEWQIALHVLLGGVFAYLLLRKLNTDPAAALLGAAVFQLGGYFASQAQHLGAMNAGAWLPLAWLSMIHLAERLKIRWLALLAASLALSLLAGFAAAAIVVYVSCLFLTVALILFRRARWRLAGALALGYAWSGLLAAVLLLPAVQLTSLSTARLRGEWGGGGGGVPWQGLVSLVAPGHYHLFDLSRYSLPWNPTFLYLYCGILGLLLAVAVVILRRSPYWTVFGLVTLLSALWMLGESTPVGLASYRTLPLTIRSALYAESAMLSFTLGIALLAGLGARAFLAPRGRWLSALAVAVVAGDLIVVGSGRPMNTGPNGPWIVTPDKFEGSSESMARLRQLVNRTSPPSRVETVKGAFGWYTSAPVTQVPTPDGDDPMALLRLLRVRLLFCKGDAWARHYEASQFGSPVMSLLNVRYLISRLEDPPGAAAAGLRRLGSVDGQYIFENEKVLPRFFLVGRVQPVRDMEQGLSVMSRADFDPRSLAVVEGAVDVEGASGGEVSVTSYAREEVVLQVNALAGGYLVTSEAYYPGWRAYVDGVERPLLLTNVAFRGLPVPEGRHTITMRFQSGILVWGAWLSALGASLLMVALMFGDKMRKQAPWISSSN